MAQPRLEYNGLDLVKLRPEPSEALAVDKVIGLALVIVDLFLTDRTLVFLTVNNQL